MNIEDFGLDYIVCECFDVTLGEIIDSIKAGNNTLETLMYDTDAGTACKLCQSKEMDEDKDRSLHLTTILEHFNRQNG